MKSLSKVNVLDLNLGDRIFNEKTEEIGLVISIRETGNEWVDAFVVWPGSKAEIRLNMNDKKLFLIKELSLPVGSR